MLKRFVAVILIIVNLCALAGCAFWMDGEYYSVTPHVDEKVGPVQESVEVTSYKELHTALSKLVEKGTTKSLLYVSDMDMDKLESNIDMAIRSVSVSNAIGAYALSGIKYEIGSNAGKTAIALDITYEHGRSEILRIKNAKKMSDAIKHIETSLEACDAGVVIRVQEYVTTDFIQLVQDFVDENPQISMEMPQVAAAVYPNTGLERVIELSFTYQTNRDTLRSMQNTVQPVFASAKLYVSTDAANWEKYSQLYSFLMKRYDYAIETSLTPAYSLLRHGVGDSKAFATVYAAMCRSVGLDCQAVSGTKEGEAYYWNILKEDGVYYHVDLLQSNAAGELVIHSAEEMSGYVWDYSAYGGKPETD